MLNDCQGIYKITVNILFDAMRFLNLNRHSNFQVSFGTTSLLGR